MEYRAANFLKRTSYFGLALFEVRSRLESSLSVWVVVSMGYVSGVVDCKSNGENKVDHRYEIKL